MTWKELHGFMKEAAKVDDVHMVVCADGSGHFGHGRRCLCSGYGTRIVSFTQANAESLHVEDTPRLVVDRLVVAQ